MQKILFNIEITEVDHYWSLSIFARNRLHYSLEKKFRIMFFSITIIQFYLEANVDTNPVENYHKALANMTAYFSMCESEASESLKQAAKDI